PVASAPAAPRPAAPAPSPAAAPDTPERFQPAPLTRTRPCPLQPRNQSSADALRALSDSLRQPATVQPLIVPERPFQSQLIAGDAKVILGLASEKQQQLAFERILKEGLNVRQTEILVAKLQNPSASSTPGTATPLVHDANVADLENRLRERFGTKVRLKYARG